MSRIEAKPSELRRTRRRSLKAFLTIPSIKISRSSLYGSIQASQHTSSIPADIMIEIADRLWPADILNFSLAVSLSVSFVTLCLLSFIVELYAGASHASSL